MQSQLEQLEKDAGIEWQEYRLDELFDSIAQGRRLKKQDQVSGKLPFVMAGVTNTGVVDYVGNEVRIFPKNSLTVDIFGNVFYRSYEYGMGDDTGAYWNTDNRISKFGMQYIAATMQKFMTGKFDFGRKLRSSQSLDFKIQLPTNTQNGESKIAFDFIEKFLATLDAYLKTTGLKDYALTADEQAALNGLNAVVWDEFKIGDLFYIRPTKNYGLSNIDLLNSKGNTPVVSNTSLNNGITAYVDLEPTEKGNVITFSDTTTDEAIFYQPDDFVGYSHIQGMHKKFDENIGKNHYLFIVTAFKNSVRGKYNYGTKFNRDNAAKEKIQLPVKKDNTPDYQYMSLVISAMQKVVIKNVVNYLDVRIEKTDELVSQASH